MNSSCEEYPIVIFGPPLSGATTTLEQLASLYSAQEVKASAPSIWSPRDFIFNPLEHCQIAFRLIRLPHLRTAALSSKRVNIAMASNPRTRFELDRLQAAHAVIHLFDAQEERLGTSLLFFDFVEGYLAQVSQKPARIIQLNKSDLPNSIQLSDDRLSSLQTPVVATAATTGRGLSSLVEALLNLIAKDE